MDPKAGVWHPLRRTIPPKPGRQYATAAALLHSVSLCDEFKRPGAKIARPCFQSLERNPYHARADRQDHKPAAAKIRVAGGLLADVERAVGEDYQAIGNWSPGQIFMHLARVFNDSIDGSSVRLPLFFRLIGPLLKKKLVQGPMSPGVKLPESAAKVMVPGPTSTAEVLAALRGAIARLRNESKRSPSPFFGPMTSDEWNRLHLNHAVL